MAVKTEIRLFGGRVAVPGTERLTSSEESKSIKYFDLDRRRLTFMERGGEVVGEGGYWVGGLPDGDRVGLGEGEQKLFGLYGWFVGVLATGVK